MTKTSSGVYQLPNGMWGYRYAYMLNGKQRDLKRTKDENGNPFKTERAAFDQSEKEVLDLHSRISQGLREAKKNGSQIGLPKGTTLETKKSILCKSLIKKHSKDFGGSLEDPDVIKLCGCSRNSYYKYKREMKVG